MVLYPIWCGWWRWYFRLDLQIEQDVHDNQLWQIRSDERQLGHAFQINLAEVLVVRGHNHGGHGRRSISKGRRRHGSKKLWKRKASPQAIMLLEKQISPSQPFSSSTIPRQRHRHRHWHRHWHRHRHRHGHGHSSESTHCQDQLANQLSIFSVFKSCCYRMNKSVGREGGEGCTSLVREPISNSISAPNQTATGIKSHFICFYPLTNRSGTTTHSQLIFTWFWTPSQWLSSTSHCVILLNLLKRLLP